MKPWAFALGLVALVQAQLEVNVNLRQTTITVRDRSGQIVRGLEAGDFILEEDGIVQPIRHFTEDSETPIALGIVVDVSQSMGLKLQDGSQTRLSAAIATGQLLTRSMKPGDEFILLGSSSDLTVREKLTKDPRKIEDRLAKLQVPLGGRSSMVEHLDKALKELRKSTNRKRALVLITDAELSGERDRTRKILENSEILIYTFVINDAGASLAPPPPMSMVSNSGMGAVNTNPPARVEFIYGKSMLNLLAGATGGRFEIFSNTGESTTDRMQNFARDIAAELRGQYTIGYYPRGGSPRNPIVHIRAKSPEYQARVRRDPMEIALQP